jgi:hypothetical protein
MPGVGRQVKECARRLAEVVVVQPSWSVPTRVPAADDPSGHE